MLRSAGELGGASPPYHTPRKSLYITVASGKPFSGVDWGFQGAQYPLIKESTLKTNIKAPIIRGILIREYIP